MPDTVMEHARDVTIKLHHRIGRYLQVHLYFALRWIMLSEISFISGKPAASHFFFHFYFFLILIYKSFIHLRFVIIYSEEN